MAYPEHVVVVFAWTPGWHWVHVIDQEHMTAQEPYCTVHRSYRFSGTYTPVSSLFSASFHPLWGTCRDLWLAKFRCVGVVVWNFTGRSSSSMHQRWNFNDAECRPFYPAPFVAGRAEVVVAELRRGSLFFHWHGAWCLVWRLLTPCAFLQNLQHKTSSCRATSPTE